MIVRIRDSRDVRGPLCGTVKLKTGRFAYADPATWLKLRDPVASARLEERLKGHTHVRVFV